MATVPSPLRASPAAPVSNPAPAPSECALQRALSDALALHDADRVLAAAGALSALSARAPAAFAAELDADPRVRRLRAEAAEVRALVADLASDGPEWVRCYDGACTKVDYRAEEDTVSHTLRATGEIRAPLRHVAALLNEPDLFPQIFWFVVGACETGSVGRFRRGADFTMYAPPPLHNRDVSLFGYAVDALEEDGSVVIVSRDRKEDDGVGAPTAEGGGGDSGSGVASSLSWRKTVRARVHASVFELRPVSPSVTKVRALCNADPNMSYVPMLLINWGSRVVMRFALAVLEARARRIETLPHAKRLEERPVYDWIDARLVQFWENKGYSEAQVRAADAESARGRRGAGGGGGGAGDADSDVDVDTQPAPPSTSTLLAALTPSLSSTTSVGSLTGRLKRMVSR